MRKSNYLIPFVAAVAAGSLIGCGDTTGVLPSLYNDSTVTLDIAASSGDAAATAIQTMSDNEGAAALQTNSMAGGASLATTPSTSVSRTRTCYDASNAVVANCTPLSSVRKIVSQVTIDGSRSRSNTTTGGTSATWTGAVHRVSNDTLLRVFNSATPPVETARTHNDLAVGHDTTTFTDATTTRLVAETTRDSVKGVTWNMPRSTNPFPVSGSIVRVDSVHVSVTKASQTTTRDVVRTVTVTFPADAQGNVVLTVNGKTCNLNLVSHDVSACH